MKKLIFVFVALFASMVMVNSCKTDKPGAQDTLADSSDVKDSIIIAADSSLHGICGEGTSMHNLQLICDNSDTIDIALDPDRNPGEIVFGGLLNGDKLVVMASMAEDGFLIADKVINVNTLIGKWANRDLDVDAMEILEDGTVVSDGSLDYNSWKLVNAQLLLNNMPYDILNLSADSLEIENGEGIHVYKRVKIKN